MIDRPTKSETENLNIKSIESPPQALQKRAKQTQLYFRVEMRRGDIYYFSQDERKEISSRSHVFVLSSSCCYF